MRHHLVILAAAALLTSAGAAAAAAPFRSHGAAFMPSPGVESVTPPSESPVPAPVNPGALAGRAEFGFPAVNSGAIVPLNQQTITNQPSFGALPGSPGSTTYDPTAALPSLDNAGSALAPNPTTSAAGFGSPNTNSGTTPSLNGGG